MRSVPGLSLDPAATILSPQQDPKACQSYKLEFREADNDQQQETSWRAQGRWQLSVKRGRMGNGRGGKTNLDLL